MLFIDRARTSDIEALIRLYALVYGRTYPHAFGTDPEVAKSLIGSPQVCWYVARDSGGRAIASTLFDIDHKNRIGKLEGLVVHPDFRREGVAAQLVSVGTTELLGTGGPVDSIYTTTRTQSIGPQRAMLVNGYRALGIFPNAHRLEKYETLTLLARHREGVLGKRHPIEAVPRPLEGLLEILDQEYGISTPTRFTESPRTPIPENPLHFELIFAPEFVRRRFAELPLDDYDRFFPFHQPNFLMASKDGSVEIYAHFSRSDRYCAITSLNVPVYELAGRLGPLLEQLKELGVSYLELLLGLEYGRSIDAAIDAGFLPSAVYPAMRPSSDGYMEDFVVLSRTLEPLDFRDMKVAEEFMPFINHYVSLWRRKMIESIEVIRAH